jgi:phospholipid/cholesterol/gamma-HCH transport system permease protein
VTTGTIDDSGPAGGGRARARSSGPLARVAAGWDAVARSVLDTFSGIGARAYFARDLIRGFSEPGTYMPELVKQLRAIGVDSLPLASLVAAFIGSVIALQTRYQLFPGIQLSVVGLIARQMVILELGPLLTGLVLAGRIGAQMTAEIGTMRVTEQIDALETLAYDPMAYLVVPRVLAALIMLPVLTIYADAIGVGFAFLTSVLATGVHTFDFRAGLRLGYKDFQVFYSLLKAVMFGGAISFLCSYEGYVTGAGAEGVGRSTAKAVVISSIWILILDALTAAMLAPYLQA